MAYGSCEKLVKESARQAAYTIPQASDKSVPIPKTEDGEDLGVGESWWYQSRHALSGAHAFKRLTPYSTGSDANIQYLGSSNIPAYVSSDRPHAMLPC